MSYEAVIDGLSRQVWVKIDKKIQNGHLEERFQLPKNVAKAVHTNKELFAHFLNKRLAQKYPGLVLRSLLVQYRNRSHYINWAGSERIGWLQSLYVKYRISLNSQHEFTLDPTLATRLFALEAKMEEVYNAPGMPGYIQAKNSFNSKL